MTHDEAITVTAMVVSTWPVTRLWDAAEMDAYARGLERLDAGLAVQAVAVAQQHLTRRPSVAELKDFYDIERAKHRASIENTEKWPTKRDTVPLWVRRWVAARYLYRQFGHGQDMRRFPEQGDWGNPYTDLMPPDAWQTEAEHVTDDRVWATLKG